ncbi:MAG: retropepsin-like domain-containing protein [Rhodospirillales bacterium]|nr:retropepsin-like domain-containing protein [Rhodospirillales bacterium]
MPLYKAPFDPDKGPYIDVFISKPLSIYNEDEAENSKVRLSMLIDTGASKTGISPAKAQEIGLNPTGKQKVQSVTGQAKTNLYCGDLMLEQFTPCFYIPDMSLMQFEATTAWRDGILGRDFLSRLVFEMNGFDRTFTLTI